MAQLEHANITVSNPSATVDMLKDLFGWHIRWAGKAQKGGDTIHVGNPALGATYMAIYGKPNRDDTTAAGHSKGRPLNHIGVVVDDLDAVEARAVARGLKPFAHDDYDPGRRFYLFDHDGIEWEIISYD